MSPHQNKKTLSRRNFLKSTAAMAAATAVPKILRADEMKEAKTIPVGVQLWCVRELAAKDFPKTIEAIAKMGYKGVEFAGFYEQKAELLRKVLDDNGLKCCGSHTQNNMLEPDTIEQTIKFNKILGNRFLIIPWLGDREGNTKDFWLKQADRMNKLAEKLKPHAMLVGYHNHAHDFKLTDGEIPWDIFAQNTTKDVILQLDTGNAMMGGGNPIEYLEKYPGRAVTIHLKEFSATNPKALIGEGDIDFQRVFALCESTGTTEWYIIEEEKDAYPPLVAIEKSLQNYKKLREEKQKKEKA